MAEAAGSKMQYRFVRQDQLFRRNPGTAGIRFQTVRQIRGEMLNRGFRTGSASKHLNVVYAILAKWVRKDYWTPGCRNEADAPNQGTAGEM
jgi:hypothetical protein